MKNLARQHEIEKAKMVYKSFTGWLQNSENKLCMPLPRTSYYIDSYSGTILWNISHTKWGKQSPLRNSNVFLNKYSIYIDLGHEIRGM